MAAGLFNKMKEAGFACELATEFAKDLTWEESPAVFCQPYVFGVQYLRIKRLVGKVDYVITDSPIMLSCYYGDAEPDAFKAMVYDYHRRFDNMNYMLTWPIDGKYQTAGRRQDENEARQVHDAIWGMTNKYNLNPQIIYPDARGVKLILEDINALHSDG